jgi:hypothetical protein
MATRAFRTVLRCIKVGLFAASWAPAQDQAPAAPAHTTTPPQLRIQTLGPDGWRQRLGPTNLGSMLTSARGQALWREPSQALLGWWQIPGAGADATKAAQQRLLGYSGRVQIGVWFATEGATSQFDHAALVLHADGHTDLSALATDLEQALYRERPGEWVTLTTAGTALRARLADGMLVTAPICSAQHLQIVHASTERIAAALADAAALTQDVGPALAVPNRVFHLSAAAAPLVRGWSGRAAVDQALGLTSLAGVDLAIGTAGPHVQLEAGLNFSGPERGLFGVLFPDRRGVPALAHQSPKAVHFWRAGRVDLRNLMPVMVAAAAAADAAEPDVEQAQLKRALGIDLHQDLLLHTGDEYLLTVTAAEPSEELSETTWGFALRLTDEGAFSRSFATMLQQLKPYLSKAEEETHGTVPLRRYGNMFGYPLWLAVGNGLFTAAGGRDAEAMVRSLLDAGRAATAELPTLPEAFADLPKHLPPGSNGLGQLDAESVLSLPDAFWFDFLLPSLPWPWPHRADGAEATMDRAAMRALLREHHLDRLRTATGYREDTWRFRLYW